MRRNPNRASNGICLMLQREVAEILNTTTDAIKVSEARALRKLQQAIQKEAKEAGCSVRAWLYGNE
jgi:hypothetical protein